MASFSKRYTFVPGEAQSSQANQNFDDIADFLNNSVVHVDGSKSMTGILALPAVDPTSANQATRKAYVDANDAIRLRSLAGTSHGHGADQDMSIVGPLVVGESRSVTLNVNNEVIVNFPQPFPTRLMALVVSNSNPVAVTGFVPSFYAAGTTGFTLRCEKLNGASLNGITVAIDYIALGF